MTQIIVIRFPPPHTHRGAIVKGQGAKEKRSAARLAKQQAWLLANAGDATAAPGLKGFAGFQGEGEKKEPPTPTPSE